VVPRVSRPGHSFTGAWKYYAHDKRTEEQREAGQAVRTRERVAFIHTENLSGIEDDRAAVGLMIDTARQSRRCEKPVYAFSLAWHPDEETPDKAHMIETARKALAALGMQAHQALMIAHTDTAHPHVHVIVNRVHPDTGKAINLYKDQEKLQAWALDYERTHGKVYCQARVFNALARQVAKEQDGRPAPRRYVDNTLAECWSRSESGRSFKAALEAKGWGLAKGDRKENVLMAVTPSGRAFSVLRELNKGLPKGQSIKGADFDRQTADLKREDLPSVAQVQAALRAAGPRKEKARTQEPERIELNTPPDTRGAFHAASQNPPTEEDAGKQQAQEAEHRERFETWAARERQRLFSRQLEDRDTLHLAHERTRQLWANRVGESFDRRRRETSAEMRAIEERQGQTGLKGWIYRISGKAETEREELDALRVRKHDLTREQNAAWEAMEAPLRGEAAALKERQEGELRRLERRLVERWEQSWSRADHRANENTRAPKPERKPEQSHGRGGRSRSRDYD
jgi:hypothetical protein